MNTLRFRFGIIASLLAVLTLLGSLAPSTAAQVVPGDFLATQFLAAIGDEAAAYPLASNAVLHTPEGDYHGRAGLVQFGDGLAASFSDLAFATQAVAQAGDPMIVSFTLTGINTGAYQELAANCAGIAVPGVAMLRLDTQQVVAEQWISYDTDLIASQISSFNQLDASVRPGCD